MFAYDDLYNDKISGMEDARIVSISPLFNDKNTLEFNLGPDKRFLKLSATKISFSVEIPGNYTLDNDVFAKLVENTEIIVNHESITRKSSQLDNSVTSAVLNKVSYDDSFLNTSLRTHGIFEAK